MAVDQSIADDFVKNQRGSRHEGNMRPESSCAEVRIGEAGSLLPAEREAIGNVVVLYDRYFDFVWRSLKRLGVFTSDLEDAAQDVFIVVHRRINEFEHRALVKSWIFAIALRVAMAYRRRGLRQRSRIAGDETLLVCSRGTPEQVQSAMQTAEQVQTVLNGMDDDKRAVFVLADLEQMSGEEIAAALGIPRGTVYSRLRLARVAFKDGFSHLKAKDDWRSR
jgi:RNA polymerase sigma-70 factor (ECF subfamily)